MIRQMFLSIPIAILIGLSTQVVGQVNKIPDRASAILKNATQFELLSIGHHPSPENSTERFQGWPVIGKTMIADPNARNRLIAAMEKGVKENKGDSMKCFNPRHGIRVTHEGMTADFLICFECFQVMVYVTGEKEQRVLITDSPASVFNQTLQNAKVPLAQEPDKKQ
ncbi:MAG TPA: hypothetical protein VJ810_04520 [Blastocatellia bacterium]|nr:hypothetical protein [Blastocatellia bacterium]